MHVEPDRPRANDTAGIPNASDANDARDAKRRRRVSGLRCVLNRPRRGGKAALFAGLCAMLFASSILVLGAAFLPASAEAKDGGGKGAPKRLYASAFVSGRSGYRIIHYWSDGPKMRAETLIGGHPITTIVRGDQYLVFDRLTNKGLAITRAKQAQSSKSKGARLFGNDWVAIRDAGGELVEETKLSGTDVEVWQLTDTVGSRKVWVTRDGARLPLRVETFDRKSSDTVTLDYSNWTLDLDMPKAFFEAAPEVDFERFGYEEFVKKAQAERVGTVPVLYPDLLHGARPR